MGSLQVYFKEVSGLATKNWELSSLMSFKKLLEVLQTNTNEMVWNQETLSS